MKISLRIMFLCCTMLIISGGLSLIVGVTNVSAAQIATSKSHTTKVRAHYVALGDSLAFGYEPNGDFAHGYATDLFTALQPKGVQDLTNLACPGETSTTFISGGCPFAPAGTPPQLTSALAYLQAHPGTVNPITLQIGANDMLPAIDLQTCTVNQAQFTASLATLDTNLRSVILPQIYAADAPHANILLINYYDPFQNICPNTVSYIQTVNRHLAADAAGYGHTVNVFAAFGGATVPNPNLCTYTWICSSYTDIHSTPEGYQVIANTIYYKLFN